MTWDSRQRTKTLKRRNSIGNSTSKTRSLRGERKGKRIVMMLGPPMRISKMRS
jgi:hypothetical protein